MQIGDGKIGADIDAIIVRSRTISSVYLLKNRTIK
jgi:hypothetical protein